MAGDLGSKLGVGFSTADINSLRGFSSEGKFAVLADAGNKTFALIISDPEKASKFFTNNSKDAMESKYNSILNDSKNSKLSFQERVQLATKGTIGDSKDSGISLFVKDSKSKSFEEVRK